MIVRDAEATIERCLASIRPFVDRVAIYLAGESTDKTVAILARLATEPGPPIDVVQGEWRDDFAWARERSFELVPDADWIMWADADDELVGGELLRDVIAAHPNADALEVSYRAALPDGSGYVVMNPPRLLRRASGWRWTHALHERLIVPEGATVVRSPLDEPPLFVHLPGTRTHAERNLRIARAHPELGLVELVRAVGALNYPEPLNPPATAPCAACPWIARTPPDGVPAEWGTAETRRRLWGRDGGLGEGEPMACPHDVDEQPGGARVCRAGTALQQRAVLRWMSDPQSGLAPFRAPVHDRTAADGPPEHELEKLRARAPLRVIADALGGAPHGKVTGGDVVAAFLPDVLDGLIGCEEVPAPTPAEFVEWRAAGISGENIEAVS